MDIEKAKRLLAKINVLVENFDDSFSTLENDLLKTYIKDLYECVGGIQPAIEKPAPQEPINKPLENEAREKKDKAPAIPNDPKPFAHPEVVINTPAVESSPEAEAKEVAPVQAENTESAVYHREEPDNHEMEPVPEFAPSADSTADPELEALFVLPKGEDLASRLGAKPIKLIEDAMGINDRISTINELFGKDHALFQETLKRVNGFENFDQAKDFLITGVARMQQWSSEDKAERAVEFIRLIGRKFQSN